MKKFVKDNVRCILMAALMFCFFAVITRLTPLAGDDWGYALNGLKGNPIATAFQFYQTWSGRFFSELWGFVVAPNKWLWNVLNPLIFTILYISLNVLGNPKKTWIGYVLSFLLVLYASDYLRMETYTWIMGTTYVIPMMMCCVYLAIVKHHLDQDKKMSLWTFLGCAFLNFYIGLCMENIAAVMVLANVLLALYQFFNKKEFKSFVILCAVSLISFVIMRSSPGSAYRLSENTAWIEMSLLEQLWCNVPYFLRYTFYDNKYLILVLDLVLIGKVLSNQKIHVPSLVLSVVMSGLSAFFLLSKKFLSMGLGFVEFFTLYETDSVCQVVNLVFWTAYIVFLFVMIFTQLSGKKRDLALFLLLVAGASNLVMFVSPIFGSRSSFYFYYFAIILTLVFVDELSVSRTVYAGVLIVCVLLCALKGRTILHKYSLVNEVQQDRLSKIAYYLDHPEEKDVWLPRMPIFTVHSADIEEYDTYHMDTFKQYYGLSSDCVLHFYWEE